jgi:hypothetical protein
MTRIVAFVLLVMWSACVIADDESVTASGSFKGKVTVEWLDDPYVLKLRLVNDFAFHDTTGIWVVPAGAVVDGRSLPTLFVSLFGRPFESNFRKTAVVYDYAAKVQERSWEDAQRMFYDGLLAEGAIPVEAKVMYMLLNATGPRWEIRGSYGCYGRCHHSRDADLRWSPRVRDDDVIALMSWVRSENPSLDQIDRRVKQIIIEANPHMIGRILAPDQ